MEARHREFTFSNDVKGILRALKALDLNPPEKGGGWMCEGGRG